MPGFAAGQNHTLLPSSAKPPVSGMCTKQEQTCLKKSKSVSNKFLLLISSCIETGGQPPQAENARNGTLNLSQSALHCGTTLRLAARLELTGGRCRITTSLTATGSDSSNGVGPSVTWVRTPGPQFFHIVG